MPLGTTPPARVLLGGACLVACTVGILLASNRQNALETSGVVASLATTRPQESRLYWLASREALSSCAEFTYFIRRISIAARSGGMASVLVSESDSANYVVERAKLPVQLTVMPRARLPRDSLVIVLVQPRMGTRTYAVDIVHAGLYPDLTLERMRSWLASSIESAGQY